MAPSAEYIVLDLVCPSLGVILATMTFAAPVKSLRDRLAHGSLGPLNPTPWAVMTGNCIGWIAYSFLTKDLFVLFANVPGLMVSVWLNIGAAKLQYRTGYDQRKLLLRHDRISNNGTTSRTAETPDRNRVGDGAAENAIGDIGNQNGEYMYDVEMETIPSTVPHERKVLWVLLFWAAVCSAVAHVRLTNYEREQIVGYIVNANLCFFYFAPLEKMVEVCRSRSSASIHVRTTVMTLLNSFFWLAYGFAVHDPFIFVPNGIGFCFGAMQALLLVMFGSKSSGQDADARETLIPDGDGDDHDEDDDDNDDSAGAHRFDNDDGGFV